MADIKILIVQICVILLATYLVGWLLGKVGQPQVVGEMVAGILLGPSLLGWIAPEFSAAIFPASSLGPLNLLSQLGLLLFMFMIGLFGLLPAAIGGFLVIWGLVVFVKDPARRRRRI